LLRAARQAWPTPYLAELAGAHHPVVLGAVAAAAGCLPSGAAYVAAYLAVSGPASAAVRLRGFDPLAVNAVLAGLSADLTAVAEQAEHGLSAAAAPRLDLLAEAHARSEVRLFAS
jgi:urease accessory protein